VEIIRDFSIQRKGRRWIKAEEEHLVRLYAKKNVTTGYIARELGRTKTAIYAKAKRLGITRPPDALTMRDVRKRRTSKT